ncbi:MAG TPA: nuclear transport factor 2 family protein [Rhizomicrobium sp.]|nr:nuclear transport factor 2 family protein [Rhizomicrobium sp.]
MTQEQNNRALMLSVLAAFRDGLLEPLFEAVSPEVVWKATAPPEFFRFGGIFKGLTGIKEYIGLLLSRYHFTRLEPKLVTAQKDEVWGLFDVEAIYQPTGRPVRFDLFIRWMVKEGKITEHQCLFDTAGVLIQQGDLKAA